MGQHLGRQRWPPWRGDLQSWVGEGASSARSGEQHSWRRDLLGQGLGAGMSLQHINQSKGDSGGRSGACRTSNISKPTVGWRPLGAGVGLVQCSAITLVVCEEGVYGGAHGEAGILARRHVLGPSEAESSGSGLHGAAAATRALARPLAMPHSVDVWQTGILVNPGRQRHPPKLSHHRA